ncbi:MAG: hypothetical protein FWC43_09975, partial [Planctomycetaceae bacterium]|nr:hypothetical protein [Planctomycetaceae bacterium]
QPGAQRSEATGPNRGEIRSLRCAPFPATIIISELLSTCQIGKRLRVEIETRSAIRVSLVEFCWFWNSLKV